MYTQVVTERIEETTVGSLRGAKVAAGNAFEAEYTLADGQTAHGPTIALYVFEGDQKHRVGPGSVLTLGGVDWTVAAVDVGSNGLGWVELRAEVPADRSPAKPETLDFIISSRCDRCGGKTGCGGTRARGHDRSRCNLGGVSQ